MKSQPHLHFRQRPGIKLLLKSIAAPASIGMLSLAAPHVLAAENTLVLEEIIVSARRQSENLQDVPVSVQVITGDQIQELAMTRPEDISKLAPGLTLRDPGGASQEVTLRGVRWTPGSGTAATPIYINEISFDIGQILSTMYDVGQIEVLRGPQGTTRGAPSISGAIVMGTRKPEFEGVNGYVTAQIGENGRRLLQGAVNVPLIDDKLAVRVAANFDENEANQVDSVNSSQDPSNEIKSARLSVRFQPTETITVDATYQYLQQDLDVFKQVSGPGHAGIPFFGVPGNYSGPAINGDDFLGITEGPDRQGLNSDLITLNASWEVLGHVLSYNFGSQDTNRIKDTKSSQDPGNLIVGVDPQQIVDAVDQEYFIHELRLSSLRGEDRFIDYDIGFYSQETEGLIRVTAPATFLPGAFGAPGTLPSPFADIDAVNRYTLSAVTDIELSIENYSVYGNLVFHLSEATELSGGLRWISDTQPATLAVNLPQAFAAAFANPAAGFLGCADLGVPTAEDSPIYPGVCDVVAVPDTTLPVENYDRTVETTIGNLSLSHHFTDDLLAYATVGTSWRQGLPAIGQQGLPADSVFPDPEEATSYELGIKSIWGGTLRVNAAIFQIDYKDQLNQFQFIPYFNSAGGTIAQTSVAFYDNVDAQVRGVELELAAQPLENLSLSANFSYAKIESEGGEVPCSDPSRPLTASNPLNFCPTESGETLNASPEFQASLYGDYTIPLGAVDAYIRFVANHQGSNPNSGTSLVKTDSYTIVDLFAGVTSSEGKWDVGLYGKNIFDKTVELTRNELLGGPAADYFGATGYEQVTHNLPREIGVTARYSF